MRKLVTVQKISDVQLIPGADAIEKVACRGWWCVAKKGQFKPNDICLYHEVDSFLPPVEQYAFLDKGSGKRKMIVNGEEKEGYRLKTVVLRGQISQGLALPLSMFPQIQNPEEGQDVTALLGVYVYEAPVPANLAGEVIGAFPGVIPKTDEERIQNLLPYLDEYRGKEFYSTVKLDGTSTTIYNYQGEFGVCGRALNFKESEKNTFWRLVNQFGLRDKLPDGYAVQSECVGEGINGNRQKLKGHDFYTFYVFEIDKFRYLDLGEMEDFCRDIGLKTVPVFDRKFILNHSLDELLSLADGPCPLNPTLPREGLVYRLRGSARKMSFKTISNAYLIKHGL